MAELQPVWNRLNAAAYPSSEWRESGIGESVRRVWPNFDEAQARQLFADGRVVFAAVYTEILVQFLKIAVIAVTHATTPHAFNECLAVQLFLPPIPTSTLTT